MKKTTPTRDRRRKSRSKVTELSVTKTGALTGDLLEGTFDVGAQINRRVERQAHAYAVTGVGA